MGARLMSLAFLRWTFLSDEAFRVLMRMALTALDDATPNSPAGLYFAGRELLALSLKQGNSSRTTLYRVVARAIAELEDCGAIERTRKARSGQNAVYALTLEATPKVKVQGGSSGHPVDGSLDHPEGGLSDPNWVAHATTPRNQEEPVEELGEDQDADLRTDVAVDSDADSPKSASISHLSLVVDNTRKGHGFCQPCYADGGKVVLAVDPQSGWACAFHLRQEAS